MIKARIRWCSCRVENILTLGKLLRLWSVSSSILFCFFISQTSYRTCKIISSYELARPVMGTIFLVIIILCNNKKSSMIDSNNNNNNNNYYLIIIIIIIITITVLVKFYSCTVDDYIFFLYIGIFTSGSHVLIQLLRGH